MSYTANRQRPEIEMPMKLYTTPTSPYGRIARIAAIEHGLADRLEVLPARTRETDSPYYAINPSGRVPFLVIENGTGFEDSQLICQYFDSIGEGAQLCWEPRYGDWHYGRLETAARSYLDGTAVLARELRRPVDERSPTIISHEEARAIRMADLWETQLDDEIMNAPLNLAQLLLFCAIESGVRTRDWNACAGRPRLTAWHAEMLERPSVLATTPDIPL
jgi:glutathione S-transferase